MDARKRASFDIPTRDNIHKYQCNNPIVSVPELTFLFIYVSPLVSSKNTLYRLFMLASNTKQQFQMGHHSKKKKVFLLFFFVCFFVCFFKCIFDIASMTCGKNGFYIVTFIFS